MPVEQKSSLNSSIFSSFCRFVSTAFEKKKKKKMQFLLSIQYKGIKTNLHVHSTDTPVTITCIQPYFPNVHKSNAQHIHYKIVSMYGRKLFDKLKTNILQCLLKVFLLKYFHPTIALLTSGKVRMAAANNWLSFCWCALYF